MYVFEIHIRERDVDRVPLAWSLELKCDYVTVSQPQHYRHLPWITPCYRRVSCALSDVQQTPWLYLLDVSSTHSPAVMTRDVF